MKNLSLEEGKTIKDIRSLSRLKKELDYTAIKDIRNLFRQERKTKAIKNQKLFEHEKEAEIYFFHR